MWLNEVVKLQSTRVLVSRLLRTFSPEGSLPQTSTNLPAASVPLCMKRPSPDHRIDDLGTGGARRGQLLRCHEQGLPNSVAPSLCELNGP